MTILAGIFAPTGWRAQDQQLADEILIHCSRNETDQRQTFFDGALFVCKVDIGAYAEPAWREDAAWFAALTGRPLLGGPDRQSDLATLCCPDPGPAIADRCHGPFCAVVYDRVAQQLRLLTDPLGLRPFYVSEQEGRWLFSTSLRVLQSLPIDLELDLNGVAEVASLGYFLLDHTPYTGVRGAAPGECWTFGRTGLQRTCYMVWSNLDGAPLGLEEGVDRVHRAFESALTAGLSGGDADVVVSLTGSLNSSLIAAALKRRGVRVHGMTTAAADPVSRYCVTTFAQDNAVPLLPVAEATPGTTLEERLGWHWSQADAAIYRGIPKPRVVWTGKGGSVGMGSLEIDAADVELAHWGNADMLVARFMARTSVNLPPRIIKNYRDLQDHLRADLVTTIRSFRGLSQARSLMLFLTLAHQRRHFVLQREAVDLHRIELQAPLCSPKVTWAALALTIEDLRGFAAYRRLIQSWYPEVMSTPWRSSPGHLVCPLPVPVRTTRRERWLKQDPTRRATLNRAWRLLREWPVPPGVLHWSGLAITLLLTETRLGEGIYSIQRAEVFARWLQR
ncbi:MAG TPA: hypothetical protein VES73_10230 [Lamprocystis sp. (in: g-proteobacteria)]|nr:hypothetical protein [Lamprocystis sp. (in: g-proteobacteria)]